MLLVRIGAIGSLVAVTPLVVLCDIMFSVLSRSACSRSFSFLFLSGDDPRRGRIEFRLDRRIVPKRDMRFSDRREPVSSGTDKLLGVVVREGLETGDAVGDGVNV